MVLDFILNMIFVVSLISLFNLTRYILKVRKIIKMNKDNPNIQGITIVNGEIKIIEKEPSNTILQQSAEEVVLDSICHQEIEKKEAYRVVKDEKEYYFCSWECMERFLEQTKK